MTTEYQSRFVLWASTLGRTPESFDRVEGELPRINGAPWTVAYMIWVQAQWAEWARVLGLSRDDPYMAGNQAHARFDAWLQDHLTDSVQALQ